MDDDVFETSVFINCPFDKTYEPVLHGLIFTVLSLGFIPRVALESFDSANSRFDGIIKLIEASRYSIHDLSRCICTRKGEHYRLNMPLELGVDLGCLSFGAGRLRDKRILVIEEKPYRYQAAISDLAGRDIQSHGGSLETAMRKVRNWLVAASTRRLPEAQTVINSYIEFQAWWYDRRRVAGASRADLDDYPTAELLDGMRDWLGQRRAPA